MDRNLINQVVQALSLRGPEGRRLALEIAPRIGGLTKDYREAVAFVMTEKAHPADAEVASAYAPHRREAIAEKTVVDRVRNSIDALRNAGNPQADNPEGFELLVATLWSLQGEPAVPASGAADLHTLSDVALLYGQAKTSPDARKMLANWVFDVTGELSQTASEILKGAPSWLKEKLEQLVGDARPRTSAKGSRFRRAVGKSLGRTRQAIMQLEPSFILALVTACLCIALFIVSVGVSRHALRLAEARPAPVLQPDRPTTVQVAPREPQVFELLTKQLQTKKDALAGSVLVIGPRARDDGDIQLTEAVTAVGIKDLTVVPWTLTRELLGSNVPHFSASWFGSDELSNLLVALRRGGDAKPTTQPAEHLPSSEGGGRSRPIFYVDLEQAGPGRALVSIISTDGNPGVLMVVSGTAVGIQPAVPTRDFLSRAELLARIGDVRTVPLLMRQARSAAVADVEVAQVELTEALIDVIGGKNPQAESAARRAWPWLSEEDKKRLPEPLRPKAQDREAPTLERLAGERVQLKP